MNKDNLTNGLSVEFRVGKYVDSAVEWITDIDHNFILDLSMLRKDWISNMTNCVFLGKDDEVRQESVGVVSLNSVSLEAVAQTAVFNPADVGKRLIFSNGLEGDIADYNSSVSVTLDISAADIVGTYVPMTAVIVHNPSTFLGDTVDGIYSNLIDITNDSYSNSKLVSSTNTIITNTRSIIFPQLSINTTFKEIGWSNGCADGIHTSLFGRKSTLLSFNAGDVPYVQVSILRTNQTSLMLSDSGLITGINVPCYYKMTMGHDMFNEDYYSYVGVNGITVPPKVKSTLLEPFGYTGGNIKMLFSSDAVDHDTPLIDTLTVESNILFTEPVIAHVTYEMEIGDDAPWTRLVLHTPTRLYSYMVESDGSLNPHGNYDLTDKPANQASIRSIQENAHGTKLYEFGGRVRDEFGLANALNEPIGDIIVAEQPPMTVRPIVVIAESGGIRAMSSDEESSLSVGLDTPLHLQVGNSHSTVFVTSVHSTGTSANLSYVVIIPSASSAVAPTYGTVMTVPINKEAAESTEMHSLVGIDYSLLDATAAIIVVYPVPGMNDTYTIQQIVYKEGNTDPSHMLAGNSIRVTQSNLDFCGTSIFSITDKYTHEVSTFITFNATGDRYDAITLLPLIGMPMAGLAIDYGYHYVLIQDSSDFSLNLIKNSVNEKRQYGVTKSLMHRNNVPSYNIDSDYKVRDIVGIDENRSLQNLERIDGTGSDIHLGCTYHSMSLDNIVENEQFILDLNIGSNIGGVEIASNGKYSVVCTRTKMYIYVHSGPKLTTFTLAVPEVVIAPMGYLAPQVLVTKDDQVVVRLGNSVYVYQISYDGTTYSCPTGVRTDAHYDNNHKLDTMALLEHPIYETYIAFTHTSITNTSSIRTKVTISSLPLSGHIGAIVSEESIAYSNLTPILKVTKSHLHAWDMSPHSGGMHGNLFPLNYVDGIPVIGEMYTTQFPIVPGYLSSRDYFSYSNCGEYAFCYKRYDETLYTYLDNGREFLEINRSHIPVDNIMAVRAIWGSKVYVSPIDKHHVYGMLLYDNKILNSTSLTFDNGRVDNLRSISMVDDSVAPGVVLWGGNFNESIDVVNKTLNGLITSSKWGRS